MTRVFHLASLVRSATVCVTLLTIIPSAPAAELRAFQVSSFALDTLPLTPPTSKALSGQLSDEKWCTARAVENGSEWNVLPSEADPNEWLSVVTLGFHEQADAYVFMFNGPDGAMSLAAHLPFRQTPIPGGLAWRWPSRKILGTFRGDYEESRKAQPRQPLQLKVVPWTGDDPDAKKSTQNFSLSDARTLKPEEVFPGVAVMVHAAAFEAGWAPTSKPSANSAQCEVRVQDQSCAFRLTLKTSQDEHVIVKYRVPWESYHDYLVRMFRFAAAEQGISDFHRLAHRPIQLLAKNDGLLAYLDNHELAVVNLETTRPLWTTEPATKPANYNPVEQYTVLPLIAEGPRLVRYLRAPAEFDWETGKPTTLAPSGANASHRLQAGKESVAAINGNSVRFYQDGTLAWEREETVPLTAGPHLTANELFYGDTEGRLTNRNPSDGEIRWQSQLPARLNGPITRSGSRLLVFSNETEAILSINQADGNEQWKREVGDVLLQPPTVVGNHVLLATKGNRLLLLDADSGEVVGKSDWPTWLVSVRFLKFREQRYVVLSDLSGAVHLLAFPDLQRIRTVQLAAQPTGPILFAPEMALKWAKPKKTNGEENLLAEISETPIENGPVLLVADVEGFLSLIPLIPQ